MNPSCYCHEVHFNETICSDVNKIRDTKGTFHAKIGTIKDRNGRDLTEAEDIKKRWQEYWSGLPLPSPKYIVNVLIFTDRL